MLIAEFRQCSISSIHGFAKPCLVCLLGLVGAHVDVVDEHNVEPCQPKAL
jgi:hypothetical protein